MNEETNKVNGEEKKKGPHFIIKHFPELFLLAWVAILLAACIALYFYDPEIKREVDYKIASWRIEHKLEEKYGIEFDVFEKTIEEGNSLRSEMLAEPDREVKYTFRGKFGAEGDEEYIAGIVDRNMEILADSYSHYVYKDEVLKFLTDSVSDVISEEEIYAACGMFPWYAITFAGDTDSFDTFIKGTKTYEPLYLLIDENRFEEKLDAIRLELSNNDFPFSVLIAPVASDEMKILREHNFRCFYENNDECKSAFESMHFSTWWDITEDRGKYYLWYQNKDNPSLLDMYDAIIKDEDLNEN